MARYENLGIWKYNMVAPEDSLHKDALERLTSGYKQFWDRAVILSQQIQRDLPQLTLHDDKHFEALWECVNKIAGESYNLSPLEVFILGGAILLHDAGNTLAAYEGGKEEVEQTPEWKDAVADWEERSGHDGNSPIPEEAKQDILLETLRSIHAERACTLASFKVEVNKNRTHLIQDDQLRDHAGRLIGEIAASHHWDIGTLQSRLGGTKGAYAGFPSDWTIRPVLLACLLRCADAAQLDQGRTPDFLYGLLQLRGLSEQHWRAQNHLAQPYVMPEEPDALVFTSTQDFGEADAAAWWIAHDAIQVAHRELQATNNLLRDIGLTPLKVNRIRGAESAMRLAEYVRVSGWRPVSAEVKVSRVDKIVDMFGGAQLYGKDLTVPIRELIQNAADAIRFRRELESENSTFEGRVTLRVRDDGANDYIWLDVEDDGLGMSEAVMTGPLIDFGSSYMTSSLVKSEHPGLLSKRRKRIGKYGIGFFSCFMLSNDVQVTSRPFDKGVQDFRTLKFSDGSITRPILLESAPENLGAIQSTRVSLKVLREQLEKMLTIYLEDEDEDEDEDENENEDAIEYDFDDTLSENTESKTQKDENGIGEPISTIISFADLVGFLCPMLDVDIYVEEAGSIISVHSRRWYAEDRVKWLKRITLFEANRLQFSDIQLGDIASRMRYLDPSDKSAGLAAITHLSDMGVHAVGGFDSASSIGKLNDDFAGAIDTFPEGPKRGSGRIRAGATIATWASEQAQLAAKLDMRAEDQCELAQYVAEYGGDASPIAIIQLNDVWSTLDDILHKLQQSEAIYAPLNDARPFHAGLSLSSVYAYRLGRISRHEFDYILPTITSLRMASEYYEVPVKGVSAPWGFVSLLTRRAKAAGLKLNGRIYKNIAFARYKGEDSPREELKHGDLIEGLCLKLSLQSS